MDPIIHEKATHYIRSLCELQLPELYHKALELNIPIIEPEVTSFLSFLLTMTKPKKILEIGTGIGYSTSFFATACPQSSIITIEKNQERASMAEEVFKRFSNIELLNTDAVDALNTMIFEKQSFDFIFIDAAKSHYNEYFKLADMILKRNGIIVCDNILFHGYICEPNSEFEVKKHRQIIRNLKKFNTELKRNKNYKTTFLTIEDGMSVSFKL